MDWSLVLVSQGIETSIERAPEDQAWQLIVLTPDYARAVRAITEYRRENQRPVWRHELPWTGLIFDWRCLAWCLFLVLLFAIEATGHGDLRRAGLMDNQAVRAGEWWRVITAVTLHADLAHLAANVSTGLLLLGLAMGTSGPGIGLLLAFVGGVTGNLVDLLIYPPAHQGLGASGMIMGALGLLSAQWISLLRCGLTPRQLAVRGVLSGCLLLLLLGFSPQRNVDVLAHVVGFAAGVALGAGLAFSPPRWRTGRRVDRAALLAVLGVLAAAWWRAVK